jgi:hypothetical protein
MNKKVHYIGLDVHKETIAVTTAPPSSRSTSTTITSTALTPP